MLDRERTEVRRNGEWLDMPMEDLFRLARTSTVAQILERDDFAKRYSRRAPDLDPRAALPAASGLRLGGGALGRRARRYRPEVQPAPRARRPAGLRHAAAVGPHHADPARHRRRAEDVQVARQLRGRGRAARRGVRQAHAGARRRHAGLLRAAGRRAVDPRQSPRDQKRTLARAITERLHGAEARGDGGGALRPPARGARRARRRRGARLLDATTAPSTCRRCSRTPSACPARRAAGCWPRPGCRLDGEPLDGDAWTSRPPGSTAPCCRSGRRPIQAAPAALERRSGDWSRPPSAVLHCSVALGTVWNHPTDRARGL